MILIFSSPNFTEASMVKNHIEEYGIACILNNQYTGAALATGATAAVEYTWPEVWVIDEAEADQAKEILADWKAPSGEESVEWICAHCGEEVDGQFDSCWKCSSPKPPPA